MGGSSELSGNTELTTLLAPDPRDLEQKIQCKDEFLFKLSEETGLSLQSIRLLTPIWRIRSTFLDLEGDFTRTLKICFTEGKDFMDLVRTGFIITFLIKWIRIRRDPTAPARKIKMRVLLNYIIHQLLPRLRRLVDKMEKLHCKFLKDGRLMAQHPELYAESPLFNLEVQRENYHKLLMDLRNDILTDWKKWIPFIDFVARMKKCGRWRFLYWKVTRNTLCLFLGAVTMTVIFKYYVSPFGFGHTQEVQLNL